eukprot:Gb_34241 [translate_table: standard]
MGTILIRSGLVDTAWTASCDAYKEREKPFVVKPSENPDNFVMIAFPGTTTINEIITDSKFGLCEITAACNELFSSLKNARTDEPGLVHKGFLDRFLSIQRTSQLENEILGEANQDKTIVLTGHSVGGAVATLATLWILEKGLRPHSPPMSITFGSPLVGDGNLAQAIRSKKWAAKFLHVVSMHDIVPRIFLAPLASISKPLAELLQFWLLSMAERSAFMTSTTNDWIESVSDHRGVRLKTLWPSSYWPKSNTENEGTLVLRQHCRELIATVLKNASLVASYATVTCLAYATKMGSMGINSTVVKQISPYRPFGCYVFCSRNGAACIENHEAVLQMLYYTLRSTNSSPDLREIACMSEHTRYDMLIQKINRDILSVEGVAKLVMGEYARTPYEVGPVLQLETLCLGMQDVQARFALRAAGEAESRRIVNCAKKSAELSNVQAATAQIEWCKKSYEDSKTRCCYYDYFKLLQSNDKLVLNANAVRIKIAGFWDQITELWEKYELPDGFESESKWIKSGTAYRRLVEPLDIADYYRLGMNAYSGHYLNARPRRHTILEKWQLQQEEIKPNVINIRRSDEPAHITTDSCFWAYFEEVKDLLQKAPTPAETQSKLESFYKRVKELIDNKDLSRDILREDSSFFNWWKALPEGQKPNSPLTDFMDNGPRKIYSPDDNFYERKIYLPDDNFYECL